MRSLGPIVLLASAAALAAGLFTTGCQRVDAEGSTEVAAPSPEAVVARGRYLVEDVAMCVDCHTPRLQGGALDREHWLTGSTLLFASTVPMPWAPAAPAIAGLPAGYSKEAFVTFLTEGKTASGKPPMPPMPGYKFEKADAEAVAAYLISLKKP